MPQHYLDVSQEAAAAFFSTNRPGPVVMLNLLRFRAVADYSAHPELMPEEPISGAEAYQKYIDHTLPFLEESGGEMLFLGKGENYLIDPQEDRWDCVILIRQKSLADFMAFASNQAYMDGLGHQIAALEDSRLLPVFETKTVTE